MHKQPLLIVMGRSQAELSRSSCRPTSALRNVRTFKSSSYCWQESSNSNTKMPKPPPSFRVREVHQTTVKPSNTSQSKGPNEYPVQNLVALRKNNDQSRQQYSSTKSKREGAELEHERLNQRDHKRSQGRVSNRPNSGSVSFSPKSRGRRSKARVINEEMESSEKGPTAEETGDATEDDLLVEADEDAFSQLYDDPRLMRHFNNAYEFDRYVYLQSFLMDMERTEKSALQKEDEATKNGSMSKNEVEELRGHLDEQRKIHDENLKDALNALVDIQDRTYIPHSPCEPPSPAIDYATDLGNVPVGEVGYGNIVEDGIRRLIARHEELQWQNPKELAKEFVAGHFMRFRHTQEKQEVMKIAEELTYASETSVTDGPYMRLHNFTKQEKRDLVSSLVSGKYTLEEARKTEEDTNSQSTRVLDSVKRLAGGNATWASAGIGKVMNVVQDLLPPDPQPQRKAAK